ncbi:drug metabolite exporter family protein [Fructilactobacillus fructivorans]|uniref:DMT family transporter n=1 Tax=Fructilactobacillus fructivorans TaxID=1614 RepID=UPI000704BAE2|nr:DMT family transporter [Fructilactobacillus fructivorans]KRN12884.1 drug metabolite exporter family protein [Fructilactobacillus fructivorans]
MKSRTGKMSNTVKGICLAAFASTSWGVAGVITQYVSQNVGIPASWFLSARTTGAAIVLLLVSAIIYGKGIFSVFKSWKSIMWLVLYGLFGLAANMGSFYVSIQTGNAAATTILQYLSPLFILLGGFVFMHKKPMKMDIVVFVLALAEVFLSITKGDISQLSIPMGSFFWGIISGITAALYVVLPRPLAHDNSPIVVLGWGTLIASLAFNINHPVWTNVPHLGMGGVLGVCGIILFGTLLTFSSLIYASRFTSSEVISLLDAIQPVATFVLSVIFLHTHISWVEVLGAVLVILAVYILQYVQRHKNQEELL